MAFGGGKEWGLASIFFLIMVVKHPPVPRNERIRLGAEYLYCWQLSLSDGKA